MEDYTRLALKLDMEVKLKSCPISVLEVYDYPQYLIFLTVKKEKDSRKIICDI